MVQDGSSLQGFPCGLRPVWHRLTCGDTFFQLAQRYNTTVQCLQRLNPWANPNNLPTGCWVAVGVQPVVDCNAVTLNWHQLMRGDTLFSLAARYGTTVECLQEWNPWAVPTNLPVGCWLVVGGSISGTVPPTTTPVPCVLRPIWHRLVSGDTFFLLAQRYNTTVQCLERLNSWANPNNLPVGCWVVVGIQPAVDCNRVTLNWHQIMPGDTFFALAARYGTTVTCLQEWNSWAVPTNLPVGCWLVVGGSISGTVTPTTTPAPCVLRPIWHRLVSGDTFFQLAQRYNTTVQCLERLNSWANPNNLPVGCWVVVGIQPAVDCNNVTLNWHQIMPGDTFFALAARYGTTVTCLQEWNSWAVPTNLPVGCWLVVGGSISGTVPPTMPPFPCGFRPMWHQLVSGDTFFLLARRYNTTVDCLQRMNSWANPLNLPVGCWIVVSITSPAAMECGALRWHQIVSGDTLFALAQRFGTTVECLQVWNSWAVPTNLPIGCWLVVGSNP